MSVAHIKVKRGQRTLSDVSWHYIIMKLQPGHSYCYYNYTVSIPEYLINSVHVANYFDIINVAEVYISHPGMIYIIIVSIPYSACVAD